MMEWFVILIALVITLPYIINAIIWTLGVVFVAFVTAIVLLWWAVMMLVLQIKKILKIPAITKKGEPQMSAVSLAKLPTPKPLPIKPFTPKEKFELYVGCVCIGYAVFASAIAIYTTADFVDAVTIWLVLTAVTSLLVQKKYKKFDED